MWFKMIPPTIVNMEDPADGDSALTHTARAIAVDSAAVDLFCWGVNYGDRTFRHLPATLLPRHHICCAFARPASHDSRGGYAGYGSKKWLRLRPGLHRGMVRDILQVDSAFSSG